MMNIQKEINMENKELRMYGFVPYNISPIQQGIQFGHAVVEYSLDFFNTEKYQKWAKFDKTFIILNGGVSNHSVNRYQPNDEYIGTMESNLFSLKDMNIDVGIFYEPDLNDMLSAIVFIVNEEVFNKKKYPDFGSWLLINYPDMIINDRWDFDNNIETISKAIMESNNTYDRNIYNKWVKSVGGNENVFLRDFLKNFRLA